MCGFTGFYALNEKRNREEGRCIAKAMADTIAHRGPDFGDVWQDPEAPLSLAHRRLSILDLSEYGNQPMVSESDRYVIVFNGEVYNHLSLRQQYLGAHKFKGHSDTETLLALIELRGFEKTLNDIHGMFAFALWDRKQRILHFARDRFGKKPLYIGWAGDHLVFGSELKALRAHPDFKAEIDHKSLALYTQYNCVPAPSCIYRGIWQLKPGNYMSLSLDDLRSDTSLKYRMEGYWKTSDIVRETPRTTMSGQEAVDTLDNLLKSCVQDRMLSDVPLGAFLSGGIDSTCLLYTSPSPRDA